MKVIMKPATLARRAAEHAAARAASRAALRLRLVAKALEQPEGIWAELLAEHDAQNKGTDR